jgi:hypothetical protein
MNEQKGAPIFQGGMLESKAMEDEHLRAVPVIKSEAEVVADLKQRAAKAFVELCAVMDEAARAGFRVQWQSVNVNLFLHHEVLDLHLVKRY